jgi:hypothetical protein
MNPASLRNPSVCWPLLLWGLAFFAPPVQAAPKTDILTLGNGNVITCEIKEMAYGKVRAKTDDMGTLSIKWHKIDRVDSRYRFLVKLNDGDVLYGTLPDSGEDGVLTIVHDVSDQISRVPMSRVVGLEVVRYSVWDRFDFSVSAGFSWTKASETSQTNLSAAADYKGRIYRYGASTNNILTSERDKRTTRRADLNLYAEREVSGRLNGGATGGLQRNDQLGLALRASLGLRLNYNLLMDRRLEWGVGFGATANREWADLDEPYANSGEGIVSTKFTFFRYDSPKSNLSLTATLFPSLTVTDRVRFELDTALRHELVSDLFLELKYYESQDNRPPAGAQSTSDRGIVFSLGWTK